MDDDNDQTAFEKLEAAVQSVYPEELFEVLPFLATIMGVKLLGSHAAKIQELEGEVLDKLILKNVRDFLVKAAKLTPLVIIMEDLHWSDISSLKLLQSVMRLAENHRILFVNVLRPGYKDVDEMIVRFIKDNLMRNYLQIILEPLDTKSSQTLIRNMLNVKSINHSFFNQIVERASGNPFFIEEVIRSFIDEGILTVKGETLEIAENISDVTIPYTINDLLMARIDRLEERTISLLKTASVIGRSFFYRLISDVASAIDDIDNRLSYLKEIQLIREESRREEIEYLFKHALAQEAVYSSILKKKRKALHLKVAESIEKIYENRKHEFYGMLAYHYGKAEHLAKAEEYMILAGEEALKSSASAEALDYYQRAFDIYLSK